MTTGERGQAPHEEPEPSFQERIMDVVRDLEGRVKDLEDDEAALGISDQLAAMDKRIDLLQGTVLYHVRFLCAEIIINLQGDFLGWLAQYAPAQVAAREYVLRAVERSTERVWASTAPTTMVNEFRSGLVTYCKNHSLAFFLDDS